MRPTPSRLPDRVPAYQDEYVDSYLRRISRTAHLPLIDVLAMLDYPHLHFRPTKEASAEFWEALSHLGHESVDTLKQRLYEPSHRKRLHRQPGSLGKCVRCDTNRDEAVIALTRRHHICPKHHTWNSAYRSAHDMHQANPEAIFAARRLNRATRNKPADIDESIQLGHDAIHKLVIDRYDQLADDLSNLYQLHKQEHQNYQSFIQAAYPEIAGLATICHNNQTLDAARNLRQAGRDRLRAPRETDQAFAKLIQQHMPRAAGLFPEHQQAFVNAAQWCFYHYVKHVTDTYMWTLPQGMRYLRHQRQHHARGETYLSPEEHWATQRA